LSHKVQVVIPDPVAAQLRELAAGVGEPPSTLAGQMVRGGVAEAARTGKVRQLKSAPSLAVHPRDGRARWLEPYGGDRGWRLEMWGAIVALHGRYPRYLEALKDGWWLEEAHVEVLCALATWRGDIDDGGEDPREELGFQSQLADYSRSLREQGGGVASAWRPGPPPADWAAA
jgi:hypothetical protein